MSDTEDLENAGVELLLNSSLMMLLSAEENKDESSYQKEKYDYKRPRKSKAKKRNWVETWREEKQSGAAIMFLPTKPRRMPSESYRRSIGMDELSFNEILHHIGDDIRKKATVMRAPVPPEKKLSFALRYLITGESFNALNFATGYSNKFLSESFTEVCEAICKRMQDIYLQFPQTEREWYKIAEKFKARWEFPNCLGALDCKHIQFIPPKRERDSLFVSNAYNSVTLLALADSDCKFTFVDTGRYGPIKDEEVLEHSPLIDIIRQAEIYLPSDSELGNNRFLPYVIIADDAFPLERHLMTRYSDASQNPLRNIFNVRLSHARQCVERAFGILCNTFRVLQTKIHLNNEKAKRLILCCCILHNFLMEKSDAYRDQILSQEEKDELSLLELTSRKEPAKVTKYSKIAEPIRDGFAEFFSNEGSTDWQQSYVDLIEATSLFSKQNKAKNT